MRYGFAIDQRTCIGCHACTVACKTEHDIPVGQFRTWVKYVEKGEFPSTTREMAVLRCNHCTDAPCVKSCPTEALFIRPDGIVDFDNELCIGCKMCMQACPYDAIYIDENTHTAAKCNFCAHRIDQGLEPACVQVCPTESIWMGDIDDPSSGISKFLSIEPVSVRTPEQGTKPNVYYVGADHTTLDPLAAPVDQTYLWADADPLRLETAAELPGDPMSMARTTLNTAHPRPWGWKVWTYLWTKSISAGGLLLGALLVLFTTDRTSLVTIAAPAIAVGFLLITAALLIWDLKQPKRFLFLLDPRKINRRSWLALGGIFLGLGAGIAGLWLVVGVADALGILDWTSVISVLAWPAVPAAIMVAGYTAFLFGQAEGRDLWQSPALFWHLQAQAVMVGAGVLLALSMILSDTASQRWLAWALVVGVGAHLLVTAVDFGGSHSTRNAQIAAHAITHGRYRRQFWWGSIAMSAVGGGLGLAVALGAPIWLGLIAGLLVQPALLAHERVFVMAGQDPPLS
ncbi:MAG: polysulfide reductase NrfD [Candidatus Nanopelagicales bacterium]|nr:polysulfide reductase NrfD [Candidatus Nanopelagicales bacterium]MDP4825855.1 polysulfide reductase NrfD [Candidatus Nanopelagicales bacterium]